jgi:hypothetical protein
VVASTTQTARFSNESRHDGIHSQPSPSHSAQGDRPETTKPAARNRFTYYCPFVVSNEKGKWVVWSGRRWIPFRNGMRLRPPSLEEEPQSSRGSCSHPGDYLYIPGSSARVPMERVCAVLF